LLFQLETLEQKSV